MKKIFILSIVALATLSATATELPKSDNQFLAQAYGICEQVVTAYYVSGGQLVRVKIKINGSQVVAYSSGKDFVGNEEWHTIIPSAGIKKTDSVMDGSQLAREFDYTASLNISNGYQTQSLKVYF